MQIRRLVGWVVSGGVVAAAVLGVSPSEAEVTPTKPEVALASIVTVAGQGALAVGGDVKLAVGVANTGTAPVTIMVASPNATPNTLTRSQAVTIAAGASKLVPLTLKIEPRKVKAEKFTTQISVVDPTKPATNLLTAMWRDGNLANNTRPIALPVVVTHYDVSVILSKIEVHNDCNPTDLYSGKANWYGGTCTASLNAAALSYPLKTGDYETYCGRQYGKNVGATWPLTGMVNVGTGQVITAHAKASLKSVPKNDKLAVGFWLKLKNGLGHHITQDSGNVGALERLLPPAVWNGGTIVKYSPPKLAYYPGHATIPPEQYGGGEYGLRRHGNCGNKPYTATFTISTAPTPTVLY
jgi:hypothetical protein